MKPFYTDVVCYIIISYHMFAFSLRERHCCLLFHELLHNLDAFTFKSCRFEDGKASVRRPSAARTAAVEQWV